MWLERIIEAFFCWWQLVQSCVWGARSRATGFCVPWGCGLWQLTQERSRLSCEEPVQADRAGPGALHLLEGQDRTGFALLEVRFQVLGGVAVAGRAGGGQTRVRRLFEQGQGLLMAGAAFGDRRLQRQRGRPGIRRRHPRRKEPDQREQEDRARSFNTSHAYLRVSDDFFSRNARVSAVQFPGLRQRQDLRGRRRHDVRHARDGRGRLAARIQRIRKEMTAVSPAGGWA
jgi:hypothetical protein